MDFTHQALELLHTYGFLPRSFLLSAAVLELLHLKGTLSKSHSSLRYLPQICGCRQVKTLEKISILTCCLLFDTAHQENKAFYPLKQLCLNEIPNSSTILKKKFKKKLVVASICLGFQVLIVIKVFNPECFS